jgi:hypothetical protein
MIVELTKENIKDLNNSNDSFIIFGKLIPEYRNNCWEFSEQLFERTYEYTYPIRDENYSEFINSEDKKIYLYYDNNIGSKNELKKYATGIIMSNDRDGVAH